MAYETGVSTGPSDLMNKIYVHAGANGWTQIRTDGSGGDGSGGGGHQHSISDGSAAPGFQVNIIADDSSADANLSIQPSVSDSGNSVAFFDHTGSPDDTGAAGTFVRFGQWDSVGPIDQGFSGTSVAYHIFSGTAEAGRYIHVTVEGTTGVFWHLSFGSVDRAGTFDGGQYVTALNVNADNVVFYPFQSKNINSISAQWIRDDDHFANTSAAHETDGVSWWHQDIGWCSLQGETANFSAPLWIHGLQLFNQRTPFSPNWLNVYADKTAGITKAWKCVGRTPDIRLCSLDGREPNELITIGSDTWHIFPIHVKDDFATTTSVYKNRSIGAPAPYNTSGLMGFAIRRNP